MYEMNSNKNGLLINIIERNRHRHIKFTRREFQKGHTRSAVRTRGKKQRAKPLDKIPPPGVYDMNN